MLMHRLPTATATSWYDEVLSLNDRVKTVVLVNESHTRRAPACPRMTSETAALQSGGSLIAVRWPRVLTDFYSFSALISLHVAQEVERV